MLHVSSGTSKLLTDTTFDFCGVLNVEMRIN